MLVQLWTNEELKAAYIAYMNMLSLQQQNESFRKVTFFKARKGALRKRNRGSWDLRMANISYVRHAHGLPTVGGYSPTVDHVGAPTRKRIEVIMQDLGDLPASADPRWVACLALKILEQDEHPGEIVKLAMGILGSCRPASRANG